MRQELRTPPGELQHDDMKTPEPDEQTPSEIMAGWSGRGERVADILEAISPENLTGGENAAEVEAALDDEYVDEEELTWNIFSAAIEAESEKEFADQFMNQWRQALEEREYDLRKKP